MASDREMLKAAAFIAQALNVDGDPAILAGELVPIKRDASAAVFTIELDSSVGTAAFLIYVYDLDGVDPEGRSGGELFETGLATLQTAAERDAPGPRVVAHARTEEDGFILATTPATYRALAGEAPSANPEADAGDLVARPDSVEARRAAASELLRLLRAADGEASSWLAALQAEGRIAASANGQVAPDPIPFTPEETALALYLLDERSIQNLLRVLNLLIETARRQASDALGGEGV